MYVSDQNQIKTKQHGGYLKYLLTGLRSVKLEGVVSFATIFLFVM